VILESAILKHAAMMVETANEKRAVCKLSCRRNRMDM